MKMDKIDFATELKLLSEDDSKAGTIEGYGSVFNLMDRGGDIMLPGAFKSSISEWRKKKQPVPMLWQHDSSEPIGVWTDLIEDEHGLKLKGELVLEIPKAQEARALIKSKALSGLSIGYRTKDAEVDRNTGVRKLKKVELWEVSLVTFPMLPEAQISGVKNSNAFDARAVEKSFRDGGLSRSDAVLATSIARKLFLRDEGTSETQHREDATDVLLTLRRLRESVRE
jgi:HK97 family phage prohead protease